MKFDRVRPSLPTVEKKLKDEYGDDILLSATRAKKKVVCFRDAGNKILTNAWYTNRNTDPKEEKLRIINLAADIIREDIGSSVYYTDYYPSCDDFLSDSETVVPTSLRVLLEGELLHPVVFPSFDIVRLLRSISFFFFSFIVLHFFLFLSFFS